MSYTNNIKVSRIFFTNSCLFIMFVDHIYEILFFFLANCCFFFIFEPLNEPLINFTDKKIKQGIEVVC